MAKFVLYFVFTIVGFGPHFNAENVDKRILLNDPDLVHTQIQAIQRELETLKPNLPLRSTLTPLTKRKLILLNVSTTNIQAKVTFEPFSTYENKPLNSKINLNQNEGHGDVLF